MKDTPLDRMTVKELQELLVEIDVTIQQKQDGERSSLRDRFKALAESAGFTLAEIVGSGGRGNKGRSVAAKYANPDNPVETWSGRGRQPRWLAAKVKAGADPAAFRIGP